MSQPLTQKVIHLATDHAGFDYKEEIKSWLTSNGCQVIDHGALSFDEVDDFPDYIKLAAKAVSLDSENSYAIIFGGSGQGEAIVANRFPNIRATVFYSNDNTIVELSRQHNNANVFSVGSRFVTVEDTKNALTIWFKTEFLTDEKYQRRNTKIEEITKELRGI